MNISEIEDDLNAEFSSFQIGRKRYPSLFETGLPDAAIHSAGVSYLLSLAMEWGIQAIAEYPITVHANGTWRETRRIFPDSVWFHPDTKSPWLIFEFERFERGDEAKVQQKAQNLVLSYYQGGQTIELCVLLYWLRTGLAPSSVEPLFQPFRKGFESGRVRVLPPKCGFWAYKCVVCPVDGHNGAARQFREPPEEYGADQGRQELLVVRDMRRIGA